MQCAQPRFSSLIPPVFLVGKDHADQVGVVDLARRGVDGLEQLIHLLVGHLLAKVGQDVAQLAHADEAGHVLVEDLEAATVFFRLPRVAEAAGAVEDLAERVEVDCARACQR